MTGDKILTDLPKKKKKKARTNQKNPRSTVLFNLSLFPTWTCFIFSDFRKNATSLHRMESLLNKCNRDLKSAGFAMGAQ